MASEGTVLCTSCIRYSSSQASLHMKTNVKKTTDMTLLSNCSTNIWQLGGKNYLVLVYRYSNYMLCEQITNKTSQAVIHQLKSWQNHYHYITTLRSDGGPASNSSLEDYTGQ
jgi:hypothetical protein